MKISNNVRLIGSTRLLGSPFGLGFQGTNQEDKNSLSLCTLNFYTENQVMSLILGHTLL